jgi:toxin YoeB
MRHIIFEGSAFQDFVEWATVDHKIFQRIVHLIMDTLHHPFSGLGKPEPLKHALRGY